MMENVRAYESSYEISVSTRGVVTEERARIEDQLRQIAVAGTTTLTQDEINALHESRSWLTRRLGHLTDDDAIQVTAPSRGEAEAMIADARRECLAGVRG